MKMPKRFRTHCPYCNKHTEHVVERVKRGQPSRMTWSERQRRRATGIGNRGKFSKVPGGDKPTKRVNLKYRCSECRKAHTRPGFRAGRFEIVE